MEVSDVLDAPINKDEIHFNLFGEYAYRIEQIYRQIVEFTWHLHACFFVMLKNNEIDIDYHFLVRGDAPADLIKLLKSMHEARLEITFIYIAKKNKKSDA